ncbi:probable RNA-binding protein EIF1AD [Desmodus rotundus]|uniref:Probable RNA-binding protein EIF1AD n=1 Tax=Desmodus rotundus TaxID=9430 RepID=K9IH28_DESRO|nr:probable RNA-binding protein EIF1AD [Desmodus rotundus]XP_024429900.1 probable RNA-binding protein EIF1AD [Desmodus rotundus]XP_024429901.1 probable RNA-binding protein EIF1AD [Desmodus rotundus]XP_045039256.1 probable RNA-binding protein EIF1AD [Desmodus rotundus]XP_045039257.1 probable RNA-binding protein EIF1AD [Desmodus rotundus]XP_053780162.1 probable RNA-binding protein EIF1AD [Desmodus rotundus]
MSQATKRKHVVKEVLGEHMVPSGQQQIVRVLRTPGNNLHEVETAQGQRFLVSMPSKYRKNIWIKRGDFLIVDPIEEGEKVKAEISFVLCKDHVRSLQKEGLWPEAFSEVAERHNNNRNRQAQPELPAEPQSSGDESSSEDDADLFVNTNRRQCHESEEESEEEEAA